jgi:hypothetical protein
MRTTKLLNISEEMKSFLWTPPKTGSHHAVTVFSCLPFTFMECSSDRSEVKRKSNFPGHFHNTDLFDGHENYSLICTARNPLTRLVSAYKFQNQVKEISPKGFKEFFSNYIRSTSFDYFLSGTVEVPRVPDFYVRTESLYEDYVKIPFISDSNLSKSGLLKELCGKLKNESHRELDLKECYTDDMIEYLYEKNRWYFDKLGYEPKI